MSGAGLPPGALPPGALPPSPGERRAAASAANRQAQAEQRLALVERLRSSMPAAMRDKPQWLLWRLINKPGATKPAKVPFYASGQLRGWPKGKPRDGQPTATQPQVAQGDKLDRAHLATLDEALAALQRRPDWAGVGFAFLPGDGLIGIDVDHAVDPATGQPSELCRLVVEGCASFTELSPSGTGVHVIVAGQIPEKFKDDRLGLEVYAGSQYFTCTGARCSGGVWPETPAEVRPADPTVLAYLRELVDESLAVQRAEREAARLAKLVQAQAAASSPGASPAPSPAPASPAPQPAAAGVGGGGDDFKRVNDAAMGAFAVWVPRLFPEAVPYGQGYRVTSKALGRDFQEDLTIHPSGIKDMALREVCPREGRRTPIDLVLEWGHRVGVAKPAEALRWLAQVLGMALSRPALRRVAPPAASAVPDADGVLPAGDDPRPEPPPDGELAGEGPPPPAQKKRARPPGKGRGDAATEQADQEFGADDGDGADGGSAPGSRKKLPAEVWALVDGLCERFALVYGSDTAWDRAELMLVRIPAMRLAFGKTAVNLWLSRPAPQRRMVRPADLVFEPGHDVPEAQINMFAGLDLQPTPCAAADVQPMLDLLRHLCGETRIEGEADPVATAMHWILCWQAVPLQRVGTKMQTACVFHGAQGTGKNLYWDAWRDLFGSYGITVGQTELEDKYNGWISRKLAVLGDEVVSRQEMYHNKNRLKLIVTQETKFAIRGMFMETRWESNHANVAFLSNENTPLVLEDRDRRYMVIYTPLEAESALYQAVRAFLADGGLGKWLFFLQTYDVGDFGAHTKPPMTRAKEALIEASWRSSARFAYEWLEGFMELPVRVCSAEQLYRAFRRWCDTNGAKWPPEQSVFTAEVNRWCRERVKRGPDGRFEDPPLVYKQISLRPKDQTDDGPPTRRRTVRCFVPRGCGPLNGVTEGAWAWDSTQAFEDDLRKFTRRFQAQGDDE